MRTKRRKMEKTSLKTSLMISKRLVSQLRMAETEKVRVPMETNNITQMATARNRQTKRQESRRSRRSCELRSSW